MSSGTDIKRQDVITEMSKYVKRAYGVGQVLLVRNVPYLNPECMLINRKEYLKWPQFSMKTMQAINLAGKSGKLLIHLRNFRQYWEHKG